MRDPRDQVVGGVAAGLAEHLGISVRTMRIAFALFTVMGGFGLLVYGALWIVLPERPVADAERRSAGELRRWALRIAFAAAVVGVLVSNIIDALPSGRFFIPATLSVLGAMLIWRQASEAQQLRARRGDVGALGALGADATAGAGRIVLGVALVLTGTVVTILGSGVIALRDGFISVIATVIGLALITGPWWLRLVGDLSAERRARVREQERAEIAAHLHDSVLQTLALIQRNSEQPREVVRLARGQERELRTLLYGDQISGQRLGAAIAAVVAEVEDRYPISIEQVVVGDAPLDDGLNALVQALREALVNAAKHAQVTGVSLYVEVEAGVVAAYVRDRGIGFDEQAIENDRQGVRNSIHGRMQRHGGTAVVRSAPGRGTEVALRMPRGLA